MNRIISAYIEITELCNARCPYCYNVDLMNNSSGFSFETLKTVFDQLIEHEVNSITLSGGEPFLHRDILRILQYAKEQKMHLNIISNGSCFDKENMDLLLRYSPSLQLTIDGCDPKTHDKTRGLGNFHRLTNGYLSARNRGYNGKVVLRVNLFKDNIPRIGDILKSIDSFFVCNYEKEKRISGINLSYLHKHSASHLAFNGFVDPLQYTNQPEVSAQVAIWNASHELKIQDISTSIDLGCPFVGENGNIECGLRIAINGDVFPCQLLSAQQFCIGNIYNETLEGIINGPKMEEFLRQIHKRVNSIKECEGCAFQGLCMKGCPGIAYISNDSLFSIVDRCDQRKRSMSETLNKLQLKPNI